MKITDLHNDALLELPENELIPYLMQIKREGVQHLLLSVWTTELKSPMTVIREKVALLDRIMGKRTMAAWNTAEFPIVYLHIEDAGFLTPENLDGFIDLRPFSVGLTWNYKNSLAGGVNCNTGITEWGRAVIKKLEASGIQIDTAHLNRKSFYQFVKITERPILYSHTACDGLHHHNRNLTDRQIMSLPAGSIVGITFVPKFLGHNSVTEHIIHCLSVKDAKHTVAVGTDFYGTVELPCGLKNYTDFQNLENELKERGLNDETIERIFHINGYEFLRHCGKIKRFTKHITL